MSMTFHSKQLLQIYEIKFKVQFVKVFYCLICSESGVNNEDDFSIDPFHDIKSESEEAPASDDDDQEGDDFMRFTNYN